MATSPLVHATVTSGPHATHAFMPKNGTQAWKVEESIRESARERKEQAAALKTKKGR